MSGRKGPAEGRGTGRQQLHPGQPTPRTPGQHSLHPQQQLPCKINAEHHPAAAPSLPAPPAGPRLGASPGLGGTRGITGFPHNTESAALTFCIN